MLIGVVDEHEGTGFDVRGWDNATDDTAGVDETEDVARDLDTLDRELFDLEAKDDDDEALADKGRPLNDEEELEFTVVAPHVTLTTDNFCL